MALDGERANVLRRLEALVAFQRAAPADARLAGVQYDIEPYILPAFAADPRPIFDQWARTLEALGRNAGPLPLDIVLPFWLPHHGQAASTVLPAAARSAASVTVMAYRTSPAAIEAAAEPLLAWGAASGRPVHIALELGPVDDEVTQRYAPAPQGDLVAVAVEGGSLLIALDTPQSPARGRIFAQRSESTARASDVSFLGDRVRLEAAANHLETIFRAWSGFTGFALHGLIR
jgi:hypothetical protein